MLPLLPALILLLLHGPSNIERMAHDGHLPAALNAVHRSAPSRCAHRAQADDVALASLLHMSGDPAFNRVLSTLLTLAADEPDETVRTLVRAKDSGEAPPPAEGSPDLRDGFRRCLRSRDGPYLGC